MEETQGNRAEKVMLHFKLSQAEFADKLDVSQAAVSKMIGSETISMNMVKKITEYYKVNSNWLLSGEGGMLITKERPEEKNIPLTLTSEKVWQEMAIKQMKTIADLVITNQQQSKTINLLSEEISLLNRQ